MQFCCQDAGAACAPESRSSPGLLASAFRRWVAVGACAIRAARTSAVAHALPLAFAIAVAPAFSRGAHPVLRAGATVLFDAPILTGAAFFSGLWRAAVALALPTLTSAWTALGEGGADCQQAGDGDHGEDVVFHDCSFRLSVVVSFPGRARSVAPFH